MVKKSIETLTEYQPEISLVELQQRIGVKKLIRLSANENPYGYSPNVKKRLLDKSLENLNRYPDSEAGQMRQAITHLLSVNSDQLIFGNGSDELISLICQGFLNPGDQVIQPSPTFGEYQISAQISGAETINVDIDCDGQIDFKHLLASINQKTTLIWLCNPNNPTGRYMSKQSVIKFLKKIPNNIIVVIDEAYIDFVTTEYNPSLIDVVADFKNVIVLRTLSKAYGLANLRIGYAVSNQILIKQLQKLREPYNISSISDIAGKAALEDQSFLQRVIINNHIEIQKWQQFFKQCEWLFYPSQTNFIFFKAPYADELAETLKSHGYLLRTGLKPNWLRISMGTAKQNRSVRNIIEQFIFSI